MLPISDQNPTRTTPFVNYALIAANLLAFAIEYIWIVAQGEGFVVSGYGLVPARIAADPAGEAFTILSSMFMHGGFAHLGGNMLFLWIFGDNVEDALGHMRYLFFYFACGVSAAAAQVLTDTSSHAPMVGASGAIAGVLGAYALLYPRAPVTVINPVPLFWFVFGIFIVLPAWMVIGAWFLVNLSGALSAFGFGATGGTAFFAHMGGFIAGVVLVKPLLSGRRPPDLGRFTSFRRPERGYRVGAGRGIPGPGPGRWDSWR
jgi:membrane associated rhomboid family serine protease